MGLLEDLIEEILLRLAVEDLLRYKIVCKSWYSLISSYRFAQAHLKHHIACNNNNSADSSKNKLGHVRIDMPTYWKVPNESLYRLNPWEIVGSSNGLVCFSLAPTYPLILVNNPWTRELRKMPMPPLLSQNNMPSGNMCLSFGYDSSTDDYKLVMATAKSLTKETLFQVLSLKSNTWKLIGVFKYRLYDILPGILFNGALHWIAFDYNSSQRKKIILSFDLSREEFTAIPQRGDSKYKRCLADSSCNLGIVEDKLCIFFAKADNYLPCNNIWVMRSCKGESFWEVLPDNYQMKYEVLHLIKILECATSKKKNRTSFFCDDNKCLSRAWKHIAAPLFVPSLVSPYAGRPSHAKNKKTSFKSWNLKVIEAEGRQPQASVRSCIIQDSEKRIREIEAIYRRELGETENFYFHEEGNREIEEILCQN